MTIRLTVERERWWNHVTDVAAATTGLVPVVKGNGYGFGRAGLATVAIKLSPVIAVGNVYELEGLPDEALPVVLTPSLFVPKGLSADGAVLTVGSLRHIDALAGWNGRVIVKLESSMHRFGGSVELVEQAQRAGLRTVGVAIHPPIAGDEADHRDEIVDRLADIDQSLDVWLSHLSPVTYESLPTSHRYKLRSGTYLWHGNRSTLHLEAQVLDRRLVQAGTSVGYRQIEVPEDGTLVMIGAGSANGVAMLDDGRSPFHFGRERMALVEPPHMHTSMGFVPAGAPCPEVGGWVDLQRPLISTSIDELRWV